MTGAEDAGEAEAMRRWLHVRHTWDANMRRAAKADAALHRLMPTSMVGAPSIDPEGPLPAIDPAAPPPAEQEAADNPGVPPNPYHTPLTVPATGEPKDNPLFKHNAEAHATRGGAIRNYLRSRKSEINERMLGLVKRYCQLRERQRAAAKAEMGKRAGRESKQALSRSARATAVNSDYEEMQVINALQAVEKLKTLCKLPPMLLDERDRASRVLPSDCALVEDPVAELKAQALVNIWTPEERRIFVDKFQQYPKVKQPMRIQAVQVSYVLPGDGVATGPESILGVSPLCWLCQ